jgi:hypothetical protein
MPLWKQPGTPEYVEARRLMAKLRPDTLTTAEHLRLCDLQRGFTLDECEPLEDL